MLTAKDISLRLQGRAEQVCQHLLPAGKAEGGNWCVGSVAGEKGTSLRVQVAGAKAGVWADFASGAENERGDLLDLWAAVRGVPLGQAIKEAKDWLGIRDPQSAIAPKKYRKPRRPDVLPVTEPAFAKVRRYLNETRKLTDETIKQFKIGTVEERKEGKGIEIAYPFFNQTNELSAIKYVCLKRKDGKKELDAEPGCAPILFGWQAFPKESRIALICEGEVDCMTWTQWGVAALSVPNGCESEAWIDHNWEDLAQFDTIYLSYDMDSAGQGAVTKIARRLGIHRCLLVKLPHNDANECLQKGRIGDEAARWLMDAKAISPEEIKEPMDFRDRILREENPQPGEKKPGLETPIFGNRLRFMPGQVTMWTGYSFHGKSTLLSQLALYAAMEGEGVAIGSFEVPGAQTCTNLSKCLALSAVLPVLILDQCLEWMSGRIWIYDVVGIITQAKLLELMLYSVMRHGVKHIVIDSLMKCDVSSEDYEGQRQFLNKVIGFCHEYEVHGHIVGHPRKNDDDSKAPDMMDIHGGQSVSGQPDNVISVWRNNKKQEKREEKSLKPEEESKTPDAYAFVRKDRKEGNRFRVGMWFNQGCKRFTFSADENGPYYPDFGIIKKDV